MDKIIYNVSSYNRKDSLIKTIESIYSQADIINVALNGYDEIPFELYDTKINLFITDNDKGDAYKFYNLINSDGYYFTIDDDIIYPPNYTEFMVNKIEEYSRKSIMTLHSRSFKSFPIKNYYSSDANVIHFLSKNDVDTKVQFGGTGVMAFHTDLFKLPMSYFEIPNMADVWIGAYAKQNSIDIINVARNENFLKEQPISKSIFSSYVNDDKIQTIVANDAFIPNNNISVIIPTYNNVDYIDECLGSILSTIHGIRYEILVGIDSCEKTLNHILKNREKYPKTIKFFYFEKNVGTYVVKNTLSKKATYSNILFFDSDDIVGSNLILDGLEKINIKGFDLVTCRFQNFSGDFNYELITNGGSPIDVHNSVGCFMIKKDVFFEMNGYEPWICAADSEFFERVHENNKKILIVPEVRFYRRIHSEGLTSRKDTTHGSDIRKTYVKIIENKRKTKGFQPLPKLVTYDCIEIDSNFTYNPELFVHENQLTVKTRQQSALESISNNNNKKQILKDIDSQSKRNEMDLVKLLLTNRRVVPPVDNNRRGTRVSRIK